MSAKKRRFSVTVTARCVLELDEEVIAGVDDSWREQFHGDVKTPESIAEHIGFNLVKNGLSLSEIDGFADQPNSHALISGEEWEAEAEEIEPEGKRRR